MDWATLSASACTPFKSLHIGLCSHGLYESCLGSAADPCFSKRGDGFVRIIHVRKTHQFELSVEDDQVTRQRV